MKKLLLGTLAFFLLGGCIAFLVLPDRYHLERRREVHGTPSEVYGVLADLHTWPSWTVWSLELDPQGVFDFSGATAGRGAVMNWDGPVLKPGRLELSDCEAPRHLEYALELEHGRHTSRGAFELSETPGGTQVVWTNEGDLPGLAKLLGPFLDDLVGSQLQRGLEGLDRRLREAEAASAN